MGDETNSVEEVLNVAEQRGHAYNWRRKYISHMGIIVCCFGN